MSIPSADNHKGEAVVVLQKLQPYSVIIVFMLVALACNLPVHAVPTRQAPPIPATLPAAVMVPTNGAVNPTTAPTLPVIPTVQAPTTAPPPAAPAASPMPADVEFRIDCSALPAERKPDCDAFISATRDQAYPLLREITGISLSQCYKVITYKILPTDPGPGAGGYSMGDTITLNQRYSVDLPHRYDVHELLHSVSTCGHALDQHIFHGLILNTVYDRLGVHDAGYFTAQDSYDLTVNLDEQLKAVQTASVQDLKGLCLGVLMRKVTRLYFDLGGQAAADLYRSTIAPARNKTSPNDILTAHWGLQAAQVEALLEMLKLKYNVSLNVPKCGF